VEYSGYNLQCLRQIVRKGKVEGVKVGQVWLVNPTLLDAYLKRVQYTDDRSTPASRSLWMILFW
jgi:hypothetical protein